MKIAVDLHSHSGYAGGVGQLELIDIAQTMKKKGIDIFGTGDALFPPRTKELRNQLKEVNPGLFALPNDKSLFMLQTEVILSTRIKGYRNKTLAHHIILFPDYKAIEKMQKLMKKWGMKNTIGRPFITSDSQKQIEHYLFEISEISPDLEIIPAHVMTPDGILGSKNNLESMEQFYGNFISQIRVAETGLSADPDMLKSIPDLAQLTYISNSDCHSAALNRIGREFTILETNELSYQGIIKSLRNNQVVLTAEFNPGEGRYFLTGHRADRKGHGKDYIEKYPFDNQICPICSKKMDLGVRERALQLSDSKVKTISRNFKHLIPLIEVVAHSVGVKSVSSKKALQIFNSIMNVYSSEIELWMDDNIEELLDKWVPPETINQILAVKNGNFTFDPPGFDGIYGKLRIGV